MQKLIWFSPLIVLLFFGLFPDNFSTLLESFVRHGDAAKRAFLGHSSGQRVHTDSVIYSALRRQYPHLPLTIVPRDGARGITCDLQAYAAATGLLHLIPAPESAADRSLKRRVYQSPPRRLDGEVGALHDEVVFAKYAMQWRGLEMHMYFASGWDGEHSATNTQFVLGDPVVVDELIVTASQWSEQLHEEIWVFDAGYWQKSRGLYKSIQDASWDHVILNPETKQAIQDDVTRFFSSRKRYADLRVPWKRGVIYHGPPGNGKTVSIKATMNTLLNLADPIPTLYVRSLRSMYGPEGSLSHIFAKARKTAPCLLVFEDLDSLVTDEVRSYFLNEIDGLENNDGVFMIGSTNHLNRLDPAISERPSRFDRKYEFPKPPFDERVAYCEFWRAKLLNERDVVEFPESLSRDIASITEDFSFSFLQEAFVAALLSIAGGSPDDAREQTLREDRKMGTRFWHAIERQIAALRTEVQNGALANHRASVLTEGGGPVHKRMRSVRASAVFPM